jgi:hypothetical protein
LLLRRPGSNLAGLPPLCALLCDSCQVGPGSGVRRASVRFRATRGAEAAKKAPEPASDSVRFLLRYHYSLGAEISRRLAPSLSDGPFQSAPGGPGSRRRTSTRVVFFLSRDFPDDSCSSILVDSEFGPLSQPARFFDRVDGHLDDERICDFFVARIL